MKTTTQDSPELQDEIKACVDSGIKVIDKPLDQITQQDKIEAGEAMIRLFAYAGKFEDIKQHYDYFNPNERQSISEIVGHSYLAYLNSPEQHKDTSLFFWVEQVEQAYDKAINDATATDDKAITILGQFRKHIDLYIENLTQHQKK